MRITLALVLVAVTAAPAAAQVVSSQNGADIVVERKLDRKKEISDYVDALTRTTNTTAMGRFEAEICPGVVGLTAAQNQQVANRLRDVAQEVGLGVGGQGCGPNVLVVVTGDTEEFVKALRAKYPAYFRNPLGDRIEVPKEKGAAIAWHVEAMLDANGEAAPIVRSTEGGKRYQTQAYNGWRMAPGVRPHFAAGVVVIDIDAAAGLTTTQLADYAAMRIYGKTRPDRLAKSASSILTVLDAPADAQVPLTMTRWDLAFLKSLYTMNPLQYSASQRAQIKRDLDKQLNKKD